MKRYILLLSTCLLILAICSCNTINPSEEIPTYIQIDSVQLLSTIPDKHGTISHKITDVWAYYDLELLGAFELPAKIPILAKGKGQLQIIPGIYDNGLSGTRAKYPFLNADTYIFDANPTSVIKYTPKFTYRTDATANVSFYNETFEQGNTFIKLSGDSTLTKTSDPSEVFEGNWSGKIFLNDTIKNVETITSQVFSFPPNRDCYMELDFKSDVPFTMNIKVIKSGNISNVEIIGLKARSAWTKVYLNLSGFTSTFQNGQFQFYISTSLPSGQTNGKLLIDNFKLVNFN